MIMLNLQEQTPLTNREKEVYRTLRTNIEFTGIENRVIAITSCLPDDGKTTVSYNLASVFAESGKRVLYIDADLRKSVFVQRYQLEGEPKGLSHFLSGQEALQQVIYKTNKDGVYILPVGTFPSNPTELLEKPRFKILLEKAKEKFDYILVDTPPLGNVIDAAVIAKSCDASMLVIAANKVSRHLAKNVTKQLRTANPNFLGVVLNKIDVKQNGYYGKHYGGYYGKRYASYYSHDDN